jgi:hypothetical protein
MVVILMLVMLLVDRVDQEQVEVALEQEDLAVEVGDIFQDQVETGAGASIDF